jgi:hypothetical protein
MDEQNQASRREFLATGAKVAAMVPIKISRFMTWANSCPSTPANSFLLRLRPALADVISAYTSTFSFGSGRRAPSFTSATLPV